MAVLFEGNIKVMINRHRFMGDGTVLIFPEFCIFLNTGEKYSLQFGPDLIGTTYPSVADAYIAAQVRLGRLELKDGLYKPTDGSSASPTSE